MRTYLASLEKVTIPAVQQVHIRVREIRIVMVVFFPINIAKVLKRSRTALGGELTIKNNQYISP